MKFFSRQELYAILLILGAIFFVSSYNLRISLRRARDTQRKNDLGDIANALVKYNEDFGTFPASADGKITACMRSGDKVTDDEKGNFVINFIPCEWGKNGLSDVTDPSFSPYLRVIPADPQRGKGLRYFYLSNGKRFQIYASLEGKDEDEYSEKIVKRGIPCGARVCNFGRSYGQTPLDKSIEEYENELLNNAK